MLQTTIARRAAALALLGLLSVSGCGRVYDQTTTADARRGPNAGRDPGEVQILTSAPNRPFLSLGQIRTQVRPLNVMSPTPTSADVDDALRREGARLGADAVVNVTYGASGTDALGVGLLLVGGPLTPTTQSSGTGQAVMFVQ